MLSSVSGPRNPKFENTWPLTCEIKTLVLVLKRHRHRTKDWRANEVSLLFVWIPRNKTTFRTKLFSCKYCPHITGHAECICFESRVHTHTRTCAHARCASRRPPQISWAFGLESIFVVLPFGLKECTCACRVFGQEVRATSCHFQSIYFFPNHLFKWLFCLLTCISGFCPIAKLLIGKQDSSAYGRVAPSTDGWMQVVSLATVCCC